jgi:hypothetical protein
VDQSKRARAVRGAVHRKAVRGEGTADEANELRLVVDYQDAGHLGPITFPFFEAGDKEAFAVAWAYGEK